MIEYSQSSTPTKAPARRSVPHSIPDWQAKDDKGDYLEPVLHHGGACIHCGLALGFWYNYRSCDKCIHIDRSKIWNA
jgi:hypothetical protein